MPPWGPRHSGPTIAAPPTQRIAHLLRVELVRSEQRPQGWPRLPDMSSNEEYSELRAVMSDGRIFEERATVYYAPRERERIMERVFKADATVIEAFGFKGIIGRRTRAIERARGILQQKYGRGLPVVA